MKKFLFSLCFLFFFNITSVYSNIVYLDVQFIIDNSDIGKEYKKKITVIQNKVKIDLENKQKKIKQSDSDLNNQKNIIKDDELKKKIAELNELIKSFQIYKANMQKKILKEKTKYSSEILKIINPILTNYVNQNNIKLVIDKKNVLVGIKTLDITNTILDILNKHTNEKNLINEN